MIRGVTAVSPIAIAIFAGPNRLPPEAVSEADAEVQGNSLETRQTSKTVY
jgi:hypothetical protein